MKRLVMMVTTALALVGCDGGETTGTGGVGGEATTSTAGGGGQGGGSTDSGGGGAGGEAPCEPVAEMPLFRAVHNGCKGAGAYVLDGTGWLVDYLPIATDHPVDTVVIAGLPGELDPGDGCTLDGAHTFAVAPASNPNDWTAFEVALDIPDAADPAFQFVSVSLPKKMAEPFYFGVLLGPDGGDTCVAMCDSEGEDGSWTPNNAAGEPAPFDPTVLEYPYHLLVSVIARLNVGCGELVGKQSADPECVGNVVKPAGTEDHDWAVQKLVEGPGVVTGLVVEAASKYPCKDPDEGVMVGYFVGGDDPTADLVDIVGMSMPPTTTSTAGNVFFVPTEIVLEAGQSFYGGREMRVLGIQESCLNVCGAPSSKGGWWGNEQDGSITWASYADSNVPFEHAVSAVFTPTP